MGTLFKDVPDNHWAIKDIQWAKDMGLIRGYDDGTYGLGKPITREELAVILHRFYEKFIGGNK
ncbi:S-layer homology domain-containing protein [Caldanaerobacter subterraneus]|uniref:S-layer homology domain-containing protein n=2 Tax=Caldanaerobacter subterraneus TaxID=911092 RepID=A0A7Y2L7Q8_9THEO|nr:S-layer homology domain-containing protein [Caldanaerobacter subterraneus]